MQGQLGFYTSGFSVCDATTLLSLLHLLKKKRKQGKGLLSTDKRHAPSLSPFSPIHSHDRRPLQAGTGCHSVMVLPYISLQLLQSAIEVTSLDQVVKVEVVLVIISLSFGNKGPLNVTLPTHKLQALPQQDLPYFPCCKGHSGFDGHKWLSWDLRSSSETLTSPPFHRLSKYQKQTFVFHTNGFGWISNLVTV